METDVTVPQDEPENEPEPKPKGRQNRMRPVLIITVFVGLVVIGILMVRNPSAAAPVPPPSATAVVQATTIFSPTAEPRETEAKTQPTATATRVETKATATTAPYATPSPTPSRKPTPTTVPQVEPDEEVTASEVTASEVTGSEVTTSEAAESEITVSEEVPVLGVTERVRNGSFEGGFEDESLALGWSTFNNGSAIYQFLEEVWPMAVYDGEGAQRIQVDGAIQPDRYAGIYQTVNVIPGGTYRLSLHGQIRTGLGDAQASQYGYVMQLGFDYSGGQDWTQVDNWIDLPWDEQRFDARELVFYDYEAAVAPPAPQMTLFIRAWNKWADPGRVEYTVDEISLTGPYASAAAAINDPLPVTGEPDPSITVSVLASILAVLLLVVGAGWQAYHRSH